MVVLCIFVDHLITTATLVKSPAPGTISVNVRPERRFGELSHDKNTPYSTRKVDWNAVDGIVDSQFYEKFRETEVHQFHDDSDDAGHTRCDHGASGGDSYE